jgi:hypothetical protein
MPPGRIRAVAGCHLTLERQQKHEGRMDEKDQYSVVTCGLLGGTCGQKMYYKHR